MGYNGAVVFKPMSKLSAVVTATLGTVMFSGGSAPAVLVQLDGSWGLLFGVVRKQPPDTNSSLLRGPVGDSPVSDW